MVSKFFSLLRERQYDVMVLFYRYVIATCFRKILYRLQHSISRPFFTSVTGVSIFKFPEHPQTPCSPSELQRDSDFLTAILSFETENPIPNLNEQAKAARDRLPFKVYTEETHIELHTLLCELLKRFESSLETLAGYHSVTGSSGDYQRDLHATASIGYVLFRLARSAAIEKHFKAIESSLADRRHNKTKDVKLDGIMADGVEIDPEFGSIQDTHGEVGAPALWQSYLNWFRLMIVHFEAVWNLAEYLLRPDFQSHTIDIKILPSPRASETMLSWEKLLLSDHFPDSSYSMNVGNQPTNEIVEFLRWSPFDEEGNRASYSVENVIVALKDLLGESPPFDDHRTPAQSIIEEIQKLRIFNYHQSLLWDTYATRMRTKVELLECVTDSSEFRSTITDIIRMLEPLRDSSRLFLQLSRQPLSSGNGFRGSLHCELFLASLISLSRTETSGKIYDKHKAVLDGLQVMHYSFYSGLSHLQCYRVLGQSLEYPIDAVQCVRTYSVNYR